MKKIENQKLDAAIVDYFADRKNMKIKTSMIARYFSGYTSTGECKTIDRDRLYERLRGLVRTGAIRRIEKGVYQYNGPLDMPGTGGTKQEVMWRLIRARRTVTLDDLVELAGVSSTTASIFCNQLVGRDAMRRISDGKYQLINDTVTMPRDENTAERMRAAAVAALDNAQAALAQAKNAIKDMEG